jgi:hypothetical protein
MGKCSPTATRGHDIPAAITSPHDQRAHGLLQDLTEDQRPRVLTRQPLPEPSLPNSPGKAISARLDLVGAAQPSGADPGGERGERGSVAYRRSARLRARSAASAGLR